METEIENKKKWLETTYDQSTFLFVVSLIHARIFQGVGI